MRVARLQRGSGNEFVRGDHEVVAFQNDCRHSHDRFQRRVISPADQ